jgi:hypothetical protein
MKNSETRKKQSERKVESVNMVLKPIKAFHRLAGTEPASYVVMA